jgi:hypothetical protein
MDGVVTAYCSHPIRGRKGDQCSQEEIELNNMKACTDLSQLALTIRRAGINLEVYVPGFHDEFVSLAYAKDYVTEQQILDVDCTILDKRYILLVYDWQDYISTGMKVEIDYAEEHGIPIYVFQKIDDKTIREVMRMCFDVLDEREEDGQSEGSIVTP